jgi:hypothetical protein
METILRGNKSFSWPGKIMVYIIHIVPCKMIIGLILDGLFDNEVFETALLLLVVVGKVHFMVFATCHAILTGQVSALIFIMMFSK